jgi:hypothetical protein
VGGQDVWRDIHCAALVGGVVGWTWGGCRVGEVGV